MSKLLLFPLLSLLANPLYVAAAEETAQTLQSSPISTGHLLQTLLGLILVLFCIVLVAWLFKNSQRFHSTASGKLKIIASLSIGPRERIAVVQVGEEQLLLGITPQNIHTLHQLSEPLQTESLSADTPEFAKKLKSILQQKEDTQ